MTGKGDTTRDLHFRIIKTFLYWCERSNPEIKAPNLRGAGPIIRSTGQPDHLATDEVLALLNAARGIEERVMFEFMLSTGVRASEVCNMKPKDVHDNYVDIESKGVWIANVQKKHRTVPITPDMRESLLVLGQGRGWVFLNDYGKKMSRGVVGHRVRAALRRAHIKKESMGAHLTRHTVGFMTQDQYGDLRYTADLLGHAKLQMTMRYTTPTKEEVDKKYNALGQHPLAWMRNGNGEAHQ